MSAFPIPHQRQLSQFWRRERVLRQAGRVLWMAVAALTVLLLVVVWIAPSPVAVAAAWGGLALVWLGVGGILLARWLPVPTPENLARRIDAVLGLPDDAMVLSELPDTGREAAWRQAVWTRVDAILSRQPPRELWKIAPGRSFWWAVAAFALCSTSVGVLGWQKFTLWQEARLAAQEEKDLRLAAAKEVLDDWEEFAKRFDDPELQTFFAQAAGLREALASDDPMEALLEMNRLEQNMSSLQESMANAGIGPQAATLAEALESISGMGAVAAAVRNGDFSKAADEAAKAAAGMEKQPAAEAAIQRAGALAEMLATGARSASERGNTSLAEAMQQISVAVSKGEKSGKASQGDLSPPVRSLCKEFQQESQRVNRGRALALGKRQLDGLRDRLRGSCDGSSPMPSLCQSLVPGNQPTGNQAGTSPGGGVAGDETELAQAATTETVGGTPGEGESDVRTVNAATGAAGSVGGSREAAVADYVELSQKAVTDESLPLAHRRIIRTYFERIRPVAESTTP